MPNDRSNGCSGWGAPQDVTKLSKSLHANKQARLVPNDWNVGRLLPFQKSSQTHSCGINNAVQIKQVAEGPGTHSPGLADSASTEVWKWYDIMITWSALKHWIWPPLLLLALLTLLARLCRLLPLFVVRELFWPSCSSPSAASSASSPSSSSSWSEPHWLRGVVPAMNQMNWVKALKPAGRFQNYILYMPPHHHNRLLLLHQLLPGINSGEPKSHYKRSQDPDSITTWQIVID